MRTVVVFFLSLYLVSLATSQTVFGSSFFALRWILLGAFAVSALICWTSIRMKTVRMDDVKLRLTIYVLLWGLTVLASDYPLFSSYRFGVHVVLLLGTLIFIPEIIRLLEYSRLLVILKILVGAILIISYFRPAPIGSFDNPEFFRGILGNANAFGHMAAVSVILFTHGYIVSEKNYRRYIQGGMALLSIALLFSSGARSSFIATTVALCVIYHYYRERLSKYVALLVAIILLALLTVPSLPEELVRRIFKHDLAANTDSALERLILSRSSVWDRHIDGFLERPLLGWGFGVDADTDLTGWSGQFSSIGFIGRDPVNDTLYVLESGGIIGLVAYVMMISLLVQAWRPKKLFGDAAVSRDVLARESKQLQDTYVVFYSLASAMAVLFQFDNTALAAGNFFSVFFWLTLGASIALSRCLKQKTFLRRSIDVEKQRGQKFLRSRGVK